MGEVRVGVWWDMVGVREEYRWRTGRVWVGYGSDVGGMWVRCR